MIGKTQPEAASTLQKRRNVVLLAITLMLIALIIPVSTMAEADACDRAGNLLTNASFESGSTGWAFVKSTYGSLAVTDGGSHCAKKARVKIIEAGSPMQLYQKGFTLKANTRYRLSFNAYSSNGNDLRVYVHKHSSAATNFGLKGTRFDLTRSWQRFSSEFTTTNISGTTTDTRLRFHFVRYATAGTVYHIDDVVLEEIVGSGSTPTQTPAPQPTATPDGSGNSKKEMIIFDWNAPVTKAHRGFPNNTPPLASANGDWTVPPYYAQGTFYMRVKIFSQPKPQEMRLQICFWQQVGTNKFANEGCTKQTTVMGTAGNVVTWSQSVRDIWYKPSHPIDWSRPRYRYGVAIKNKYGKPVSDYNGWKWNGENPDLWYPLNMRFTTVVVAKGETFSGWHNYP